MKKSKAIIILLCALLVLLGVGYVDLYGVDAEGTASASDISLGLDLAGGVSITYQVVGDEEPDATKEDLLLSGLIDLAPEIIDLGQVSDDDLKGLLADIFVGRVRG